MSFPIRRLALPALAATLALATATGCASVPRVGGPYGGIIGIVVFILWIVAIVQILQSGMGTDKKILWMLLVIFLPLIGAILWFVIGRK